jgi:hypothetical protein
MSRPLLSARQRVAAASLLKRRPALPPAADGSADEAAYRLWSALVCSEIQRLGLFDPGQVKEFCHRAGLPSAEAGAPRALSAALAAAL